MKNANFIFHRYLITSKRLTQQNGYYNKINQLPVIAKPNQHTLSE